MEALSDKSYGHYVGKGALQDENCNLVKQVTGEAKKGRNFVAPILKVLKDHHADTMDDCPDQHPPVLATQMKSQTVSSGWLSSALVLGHLPGAMRSDPTVVAAAMKTGEREVRGALGAEKERLDKRLAGEKKRKEYNKEWGPIRLRKVQRGGSQTALQELLDPPGENKYPELTRTCGETCFDPSGADKVHGNCVWAGYVAGQSPALKEMWVQYMDARLHLENDCDQQGPMEIVGWPPGTPSWTQAEGHAADLQGEGGVESDAPLYISKLLLEHIQNPVRGRWR